MFETANLINDYFAAIALPFGVAYGL